MFLTVKVKAKGNFYPNRVSDFGSKISLTRVARACLVTNVLTVAVNYYSCTVGSTKSVCLCVSSWFPEGTGRSFINEDLKFWNQIHIVSENPGPGAQNPKTHF